MVVYENPHPSNSIKGSTQASLPSTFHDQPSLLTFMVVHPQATNVSRRSRGVPCTNPLPKHERRSRSLRIMGPMQLCDQTRSITVVSNLHHVNRPTHQPLSTTETSQQAAHVHDRPTWIMTSRKLFSTCLSTRIIIITRRQNTISRSLKRIRTEIPDC